MVAWYSFLTNKKSKSEELHGYLVMVAIFDVAIGKAIKPEMKVLTD
jgi:hypothetical protein